MDFYTERGRLPAPPEMEDKTWADLQSQFGSLKRAFQIILQATTPEAWANPPYWQTAVGKAPSASNGPNPSGYMYQS